MPLKHGGAMTFPQHLPFILGLVRRRGLLTPSISLRNGSDSMKRLYEVQESNILEHTA